MIQRFLILIVFSLFTSLAYSISADVEDNLIEKQNFSIKEKEDYRPNIYILKDVYL